MDIDHSRSEDIAEEELPIDLIDSNGGDVGAAKNNLVRRLFPRFFLLLLVPLILFTGAVIGIYVQPPGLRWFLQLTGLKPGGGTSSPIAVPVEEVVKPPTPQSSTIRVVVALGRLIPDGKVITVAPPYGSGDARIEEINVKIGERVHRGDTLALLDNRSTLESAVATAQANVDLQRAQLESTRQSTQASRTEAAAALRRAKASEQQALQDLRTATELYNEGAAVQAELDEAKTTYARSQQDVNEAQAKLSRFDTEEIEKQPDVVVAARKLDSAIAEWNRARRDLARYVVKSPVSGTVLEIYARPGEKPGIQGILDIGNTQRMTAELEVYQSDISHVVVGQHVEFTADAVEGAFYGIVSEIGFAVEPQTIIGDDPAASTDARIIKVKVYLDEESSKKTSRLTNLEVTGRIAVENPK